MFSRAVLIEDRNGPGEIGSGDSMEMKKGQQAAELRQSFTANSWADQAITEQIVFMEEMVVVALGNVAGKLFDEKNSMKGSPGKEVVKLSLVGGDSLRRMTGQTERVNVSADVSGDGFVHEGVHEVGAYR